MSTLGNNLLAQYYAQQEALPNEYRRVEYLESTGTQYIDTGVNISDNLDIIAEIKFNTLETQINGGYIYSNSSYYRVDFAGVVNSMFFVGCSVFSVPQTLQADINKHLFRINTLNATWSIDNVSGVTTPASFPPTSDNIKVFARYDGYNHNINSFCKENLYKLKINRDNIPIRNLVPCVRPSDNKLGLYDLCKSICPLTGTPFYINAGTGEFVTP